MNCCGELRGFTGKEYDPDIGLYYFNARWYDPDLGRFISEDPAADPNNCNLYTYCNNNSVMMCDPNGKIVWWAAMFIGGLFGGASSVISGGDFWMGFAMGAATAGIGIGVNSLLSPLVGSLGSFGTAALSGGIAGGIVSMLAGGDFWSGFGSGALGAAVGCGLNELIPTTAYAGDAPIRLYNPVEEFLINGFKSELRALLTGGKGIGFLDVVQGVVSEKLDTNKDNSSNQTSKPTAQGLYVKDSNGNYVKVECGFIKLKSMPPQEMQELLKNTVGEMKTYELYNNSNINNGFYKALGLDIRKPFDFKINFSRPGSNVIRTEIRIQQTDAIFMKNGKKFISYKGTDTNYYINERQYHGTRYFNEPYKENITSYSVDSLF